jgi:hypothetical protein
MIAAAVIDDTGTECETIIRVHALSGAGPIGPAFDG